MSAAGGGLSAAPAQAQTQSKPPRRGALLRGLLQRSDRPAASGSQATNAPDPLALVTRMVQAEKTIAYEARETTYGDRPTEVLVKHDPARGVRREVLKPRAGEIYVDDLHHAWTLSPRAKTLTQRATDQRRLSDLANGIGRIKRGKLKAVFVGVEEVAQRPADIVDVIPADTKPGKAPSRRFWIDQQTGLRLRSEDRDPQGRIRSGAYYLTIDFSPAFKPEDFAPLTAPAGYTTLTERRRSFRTYDEATKAGIAPRKPDYLPSGFRLRSVAVLDVTSSSGRGGAPTRRITQIFDNGLTPLSLAQTDGAIAVPRTLRGQLNPATGAGFIQMPRGQRGYVWRAPDSKLSFLLLGGLPDDEMKRIADSVR